MDISFKLAHLRTTILERVTAAARDGDLTGVAKWSGAARECDQLIEETGALESRLSTFEQSLYRRIEDPTQFAGEASPKKKDDTARSPSAKAEGARARTEWVQTLRTSQEVRLTGHGTRYQTARQLSVGIAFANESIQRPNKWFLGLPDEPTDVVVLLCRALDQKMHDLVLPMAELDGAWEKLARSNGQVKLHVKRYADELLLSIPRSKPLTVTLYEGNYHPLR